MLEHPNYKYKPRRRIKIERDAKIPFAAPGNDIRQSYFGLNRGYYLNQTGMETLLICIRTRFGIGFNFCFQTFILDQGTILMLSNLSYLLEFLLN